MPKDPPILFQSKHIRRFWNGSLPSTRVYSWFGRTIASYLNNPFDGSGGDLYQAENGCSSGVPRENELWNQALAAEFILNPKESIKDEWQKRLGFSTNISICTGMPTCKELAACKAVIAGALFPMTGIGPSNELGSCCLGRIWAVRYEEEPLSTIPQIDLKLDGASELLDYAESHGVRLYADIPPNVHCSGRSWLLAGWISCLSVEINSFVDPIVLARKWIFTGDVVGKSIELVEIQDKVNVPSEGRHWILPSGTTQAFRMNYEKTGGGEPPPLHEADTVDSVLSRVRNVCVKWVKKDSPIWTPFQTDFFRAPPLVKRESSAFAFHSFKENLTGWLETNRSAKEAKKLLLDASYYSVDIQIAFLSLVRSLSDERVGIVVSDSNTKQLSIVSFKNGITMIQRDASIDDFLREQERRNKVLIKRAASRAKSSLECIPKASIRELD